MPKATYKTSYWEIKFMEIKRTKYTIPANELIEHLVSQKPMLERGQAAAEWARLADQEHIDAGTVYEPEPDASDMIRRYQQGKNEDD